MLKSQQTNHLTYNHYQPNHNHYQPTNLEIGSMSTTPSTNIIGEGNRNIISIKEI